MVSEGENSYLDFRNLTAYCGSLVTGLAFSPVFCVMVIFILVGKKKSLFNSYIAITTGQVLNLVKL